MAEGNTGFEWGWVIAVIVILALVWAVVKSARRRKPVEKHGRRSTREVLEDQYARGEITKAEFESRRKKLKETPLMDDPTALRYSLNPKDVPGQKKNRPKQPEDNNRHEKPGSGDSK